MPQSREPLRGLGGGSPASVRLIARAVRQQFAVPDKIRRRLSKVLGDVLTDREASAGVRLKACDTVARMIQADQNVTLRIIAIQLDQESSGKESAKPPEAAPAPPRKFPTGAERAAACRAKYGFPDPPIPDVVDGVFGDADES